MRSSKNTDQIRIRRRKFVGDLVDTQQCSQFSLDVPLAQEHHTQQPIEEPSEENALANYIADDIFNWIVFHMAQFVEPTAKNRALTWISDRTVCK